MAGSHENDLGAAAQRLGRAHRGADPERAGRRSSRSRRRRDPADRRRRRAVACGARAPPAPRPRRRTRRGRCGRVSAPSERYGAAVITAPPPPPVLEQPAPFQLSYGVVAGLAAPGTRRVIVRVGGRTLADEPLGQRHFQLRVELPPGETAVRVVTVGRAGGRSQTTVEHVLGASARRRATGPCRPGRRAPPAGGRAPRPALWEYERGSTCRTSRTGAGAAWNARAAFPAASTLKLAIAVTALARAEGTPEPGSTLDRLLRQMLTYSDNAAANSTERYFGGSTSGGSALVNSMMRSLGLVDTRDVRRLRAPGARRAAARPRRRNPVARRQPAELGSRQVARPPIDLASLLRAVWLASGGRGPLRAAQPGFTRGGCAATCSTSSRTSATPGKLDREVGRLSGVRVLHKAGWIASARHDNGIVLWRGGAFVVTVMTYPACRCRHHRPTCSRARSLRRRCDAFAADPRRSRVWRGTPGTTTGAREGARCSRHALGVRGRESVSGPGRRWFGKPGSRH